MALRVEVRLRTCASATPRRGWRSSPLLRSASTSNPRAAASTCAFRLPSSASLKAPLTVSSSSPLLAARLRAWSRARSVLRWTFSAFAKANLWSAARSLAGAALTPVAAAYSTKTWQASVTWVATLAPKASTSRDSGGGWAATFATFDGLGGGGAYP